MSEERGCREEEVGEHDLHGAPSLPTVRPALRTGGLVGRSPVWRAALDEVAVVAPTRVPVLLLGPSGVGKSEFARVIHDNSPRRARPFVTVDCARLHPDRAEADLFGAVRGAYTGLDRPRDGLLAAADGGTLFLDEVGELPHPVQAQLLVVLQTRRYRVMGCTDERAVDLRVVAATSRPRTSLLEPLYWRLSGMEIELPPLDARRSDVPDLARALLARAAELDGLRPLPVGATAIAALTRRSWPGNVRELERVVLRGLLRALHERSPEVEARHVGVSTSSADPLDLEALEPAEAAFRRRHCEHVVERCGGNKTLAAERLRIGRSTLYEILGARSESGSSDGTVRPSGRGPLSLAG